MRRVGSKLADTDGGPMYFFCPACQRKHHLTVTGPNAWAWNGDGDKPTFSPSIGHSFTIPMTDEDYAAWMADHSYVLPKPIKAYCHSFITDGQIQFLNDCTHALAGQTVPLPDWSES